MTHSTHTSRKNINGENDDYNAFDLTFLGNITPKKNSLLIERILKLKNYFLKRLKLEDYL